MEDAVKIIFVDDEENILKAIRRVLIDENFNILTAGSGAEGLEVIKANRDVGVIVSDQRMPGLSGTDFLERARKIVPQALRIVLTGYADVTAAVDAINKGGAYRYIAKPWKDDELIQILRDAAQRYSLVRENRKLAATVKKQTEEMKNWNAQLEIIVQEQTMDIHNRNVELQKLNATLQGNLHSFIEAFSGLIEMRDKSVSNHSKNVAAIAGQTASAMKLSDGEVNDIFAAALLHDIGKIGIPDYILIKSPEEMDKEERREYERHPVRGQAAIDAIEAFRSVGAIIRHHHERVDGMGFPDGLNKSDIPLGSRIIGLADAADRLSAGIRGDDKKNVGRKVLSLLNAQLDKKFDRAILPPMEQFILERIVIPPLQDATGEVEIPPEILVPGMILSRDIKSGTGIMLLAAGAVLDRKAIGTLQRFNKIDPFEKVYVQRNREPLINV